MATVPSTELVGLLNAQIVMEFSNHNTYLALAAWCEEASFGGLSAFYRGQAFEEYKHAMLIYAWMLDWDLKVDISAVAAAPFTANSVEHVTEQALASELATTEAIHAIYDLAHEEKIWAVRDAFSWFVSEQVEEIAVAKENLARARLGGNSGGALLEFDREIGAKAGEASPLPAGARTTAG